MNFNFLNRLQPFAQLVMRLTLGAILIAHGYSKVFGGFHHHMDMVASLGLPRWMAYLSTGTEFFGGIAIVLGLFTRFFSLAVVIEMSVVIWKVHFKNGLTHPGGFEFPLGGRNDRAGAAEFWRRALGIQFPCAGRRFAEVEERLRSARTPLIPSSRGTDRLPEEGLRLRESADRRRTCR